MRVDRRFLLKWLLRIGGAGVSLAVLAPLGEFFIELWRTQGAYSNPQATMKSVVDFFGFATSIWFQLPAVAVLAFGLGMWADDRWRRIELGKAKPMKADDVKKLGQELTNLSTDMFRFLSERSAENAARHSAFPQNLADHQAWQADRDFERATGAQFFARFGPRAVSGLGRLKHLGIALPSHMFTTAQYGSANGIPQVLGMMGSLLETGDLARAIELSQDRDFMWQIQH